MKKLTKEQRNQVYKNGLKRILQFKEEDSGFFFCTDLIKNININLENGDNFPEIFSKKPTKTYTKNCWFKMHDYETRIEILKQCIEETNP